MKVAVCQYSFHRAWAAEGWDALRFAKEAKKTGASAIDFHAGLLGSTHKAAGAIKAALDHTGLELAALALSNNFGHDVPELVRKEVEAVITWMRIAKEVRAPVVRIFGSPLPSGLIVHAHHGNGGDDAQKRLKERIAAALQDVAREAEKLDLLLALENHFGFPVTGEEQLELVERMDSRCFRATVDVGNYMCAGQSPEAGTTLVAPYAAYVHLKDFVRVVDRSVTSGWKLIPRAVGKGDINHVACLKILRDAGFDGFVAIEYEGDDDERLGVAQSVEFLKSICDC